MENNQIKDGGPAFPTPIPSMTNGMTLRDYFAGQALAGDLAAQSMDTGEYKSGATVGQLSARAALFYRFADAMIAARGGAS